MVTSPSIACPEYEFSDVADFLIRVSRYFSMFWICRGQADARWSLLPKAGRREYFVSEAEDVHSKARDLRRFIVWRRAAVAVSQSLPENDLECLAFAQHYGLATRLLDWSTNPLVALYFAAETDHKANGFVYCYLPSLCVDERMDAIEFSSDIVRYNPRPLDRRILAQDAVFTIHRRPDILLSPEKTDPELAKHAPDGVNLVRFVVQASKKRNLLFQLSGIGISRKSLFPDLDGLSSFINWETQLQCFYADRAAIETSGANE